MWDCGKDTSEKIHKINLDGKKVNYVYEKSSPVGHESAKSPHSRKDHWHHFWTGKRGTEERKLILKWVAPMFINDGTDEVSVNLIGNESDK